MNTMKNYADTWVEFNGDHKVKDNQVGVCVANGYVFTVAMQIAWSSSEIMSFCGSEYSETVDYYGWVMTAINMTTMIPTVWGYEDGHGPDFDEVAIIPAPRQFTWHKGN